MKSVLGSVVDGVEDVTGVRINDTLAGNIGLGGEVPIVHH